MRSIAAIIFSTVGLCTGLLNAAGEPPIDFVRQVKPIFADRCIECHNSNMLSGELNLQNRELAMRKRKGGPVIVPNEPAKSMLYLVLTLPPADPKAMPATAHRIPKTDVEIIRRWIQEGAKWPDGKDGAIAPRAKHPKGA